MITEYNVHLGSTLSVRFLPKDLRYHTAEDASSGEEVKLQEFLVFKAQFSQEE